MPDSFELTPLNAVLAHQRAPAWDTTELRSVVGAGEGDRLFELAVSALAAAAAQPRRLRFESESTGSFEWPDIRAWRHLDLSSLETLDWRPRTYDQKDETHTWELDEEMRTERSTIALGAAVDKCAKSLRTLNIENDSPIRFPCYTLSRHFDSLTHLELGAVALRSKAFARFLREIETPKLRSLSMTSTRLDEPNYVGWKDIFTAVRCRLRPFRVETDQIITTDWCELSMTVSTQDKIELRIEEAPDEHAENVENSLKAYICRCGEWNPWLDDYFGI